MSIYDLQLYKDLCEITNASIKNLLAGPPSHLRYEFDQEAAHMVMTGGLGVVGQLAKELASKHPQRDAEQVALDLGLPPHIAQQLAIYVVEKCNV